jgi:hypothetical protein
MRLERSGAFRAGVFAITFLGLAGLGGCIYRNEKETTSSAPTGTVVARPSYEVASSTDGRWELRGDGGARPYYWVWIPSGSSAAAANPPGPPPLPR